MELTGDVGRVSESGSVRYVAAEAVLADHGGLPRALLVTALPLEIEAVRAHVEDIGTVAIQGGPFCECGRFRDPSGDWLVVAVESGRGNGRAQSAAERARRGFRDFDVQLMVGVGGSLKPQDAPVGSVVASERVHSVRNAKHEEYRVSSRPQGLEADPDLVEIARKVSRDAMWPTRVREPRNRALPARDGESYPGGWPPAALVAPMGSSEEVLADGDSEFAVWLRERYGDVCIVEMEGFGSMLAASRERTPSIVIRGVSDLASSDKTPDWDAVRQPVAASHAAAFSFEMLRHWTLTRATGGVGDDTGTARGRPAGPGVEAVASAEEAAALAKEVAAASTLLLQWPRTLPDGEEIERPELKALIDRVEGSGASTTVVLGAPGSGKSALLSALGHRYRARGWRVLAIKADVVDGNVSDEGGLGEYLGLGVKPSVALGTLARSGPVLLIIDQIDALAAFLDLKTSRLNVLLGLVRKTGGLENVHVVLSSRTFEFEHDVRLKSVEADFVRLELPGWARVLEILESKGIAAQDWPPDAQEVVRSPQALATYLGLAKVPREPFATYRQMLESLWDEHVSSGVGGMDRARVATEVAETMAQEETLWLASARFDAGRQPVDELCAAGVLRRSEGRIGFTHQTVFEHVLARRFAREERALSRFVLERQSSLFVRPRLLAGLNYLRDREEGRYEDEIEAMWSSRRLRRHVRVLLIDYLGSQDSPTDWEEMVVGQALNDAHLRWHAFRAVSGSRGWFARLADGFIAPAMLDPGESAERMVGVLIAAWEFASDGVVALISDTWANDTSFDLWTWGVLSRVWNWPEEALQVACAVVQRTEKIGAHDVNYVAETLGEGQPEVALRLVRACLERELSRARTRTQELEEAAAKAGEPDEEASWLTLRERPLEEVIEGRDAWSGLGALAEAEPALFLQTLWPWFESLFEAMLDAAEDDDRDLDYGLPFVADYRFAEEGEDMPASDLVAALRVVAEAIAASEPERWLEWTRKLGEMNVMAAHRLIAHGFARSPERYSKDALEYLLGDERRLVLGSVRETAGTSRRLVEAASAHWELEEVARFEEALDSYRPPVPERLTVAKDRREWRRLVGMITHSLRQALAKDRRSAESERRIREDARILPDEPLGSRSWSGPIGSIMDAAMIRRASDDDVVNAFRSLPDSTGWDHPKRFMAGGNIQLAREFAVFSKGDPERATRILGRLTPANGTRAAGNVLEALAEEGDPTFVVALLADVVSRGFDGEGFRESACRAIGRLTVDRDVQDDGLVDLVEGWLKTPLDAGPREAETDEEGEQAEGDDAESSHDLVRDSALWGGGRMSLVPGGEFPVVECLIRLRLRRREYRELHHALDDFLTRCKDAELWSYLLRHFANPPTDRVDAAKGLFERLLTEMPELVSTAPATFAIARAAVAWAPDLADGELDRWRNAKGRPARQAYGEVVALAAMAAPRPGWTEGRLADIIGDPLLVDARAGTALTIVNRWCDTRSRIRMSKVLVDLLEIGEEGVWRAVFDLFRVVDGLAPDKETVTLLEAVCERIGAAPRVNASFVAERLGTLLPHEAPLVGRLAMGLTENQLPGLTGLTAANLVDLAVTLHRLGGETRNVGVELFEMLLDKGVPEARTTLDEIDRRKEAIRPRRPRVRRRRR